MSEVEGTLSPAARYRDGVTAHRWQNDPDQTSALNALDHLYHTLTEAAAHRSSLGGKLRAWLGRDHEQYTRGLYLWGRVGRGKTFLMDLFVESLPAEIILRRHFHQFMNDVHAALRKLTHQSDPLPAVAADIAERAQVLCLDEFLVDDIGDAMILSGLLRGLRSHGVVLVTTSNTPPAQLYHDGLQRARFLPAIALLEKHCKVQELASTHDWRLRTLRQAPIYQSPPSAEALRVLTRIFIGLARGDVIEDGSVHIAGRDIPLRRRAENIAWFDFDALCDGPRTTSDYLELARRYGAIVISDVPPFTPDNNDPAKRFIHLVDAFYDCGVKLILSAACPIVDLYEGDRLRAEFARTQSRLIEMQSEDYLGRAHGTAHSD